MGYAPAQGRSIAIRVMYEGSEKYSFMALTDGGTSLSTTTHYASGDFEGWVAGWPPPRARSTSSNGIAGSASGGDVEPASWLRLEPGGAVVAARPDIVLLEVHADVDLGGGSPRMPISPERSGLLVAGESRVAAYRIVDSQLEVIAGPGHFDSLGTFLDLGPQAVRLRRGHAVRRTDREAAFTDFVAARQAHLRRIAYALCGDWHKADDLLQTALTKLYVAWPRIRHEGNEEAYVRQIMVRANIDDSRRPWRRERSTEPCPSTPRAPSQLEERSALFDALQSLPEQQRKVVVLRHWLGLSVRETATELRISEGTVKSHSSRGLTSLQAVLEPQRSGD